MNKPTPSRYGGFTSLKDKILHECEAMASYAFESGLQVPGGLIQMLEQFGPSESTERGMVTDQNIDKTAGNKTESTQKKTIKKRDNCNSGNLALAHHQLAQIVSPATPRTILLLATEAQKRTIWRFLGSVPLIRHMMLVAILSLAAFIALSVSESVKGVANWSEGYGMPLLLEELFLISAAGLGASFLSLFQANRYIVEGTYDPKYVPSYWIRYVLGIISGIILAQLIPIDQSGTTIKLAKPTLAMVGGFSAAVVYRILNRIIETIESLIRGDSKSIIAAQEQAAKARFAEQATQSRLKVASDLISLQQQLNTGGSSEDAKQKLNNILESILPLKTFEIATVTKDSKSK